MYAAMERWERWEVSRGVWEDIPTISRLRTATLFAGVLAYTLLVAQLWFAAAQSSSDREYLQPFSIPFTVDQPPILFRASSPRLAVPSRWSAEDVSLLTSSGVLDKVDVDIARLASVSETAFGVYPLLTVLSQHYSKALLVYISQLAVPLDPTTFADMATSLFEPDHRQFLPYMFTTMRVQGSFRIGLRNAALHYALYTGGLAEDPPHDLIAGTRIGYTAGAHGFTFGVDYLYGQRTVSLDMVQSYIAIGELPLGGRAIGALALQLLHDLGRVLGEGQMPPGAVKSEAQPLAVYAKPALHINRHWTIFYRYDRVHLGQGLPNLTEHAMGLKFTSVTSVQLRMEVMLQHIAEAPVRPMGLRIAGLVRF
jgi:hypothetical protein